jgi:glycosyltransferase involved in cell wall biosynthesis
MRIAVEARTLCLPELRGIGVYLSEILAAWPDPADSFVLIVPRPVPAGRLCPRANLEVMVVPEPRGSRFRVWDWLSLPRAVRQAAPDLLWSPANQAVPVKGLLQVVTIHDTLLQELVQHTNIFERFFHRVVCPMWVRGHAARVITVSRFSRGRIKDLIARDRPPVRVIGNGATLPAKPFAKKGQALAYLREKGLVTRPYVLALGAESSWKNTEGAMRAFALVSRAEPDMDFVLAGVQDRAQQRFNALRQELGLGQRLNILGYVDRFDRDALYQGARVFVYPSLFEGFGLPLLEAMALETPVVASKEAAIPEVTGRAALLADASDPKALAGAILAVLRTPELAAGMVASGLVNIERFTWEDSAKAHWNLFRECLNQ